jgi:hypothetical protein
MRALVFAAALFAVAGNANADAEVRAGANFVRITHGLCEAPAVVEKIKEAGDHPLRYLKAIVEIDGARHEACWRPSPDGMQIFLRYGDGDAGLIPLDAFKPVKEA